MELKRMDDLVKDTIEMSYLLTTIFTTHLIGKDVSRSLEEVVKACSDYQGSTLRSVFLDFIDDNREKGGITPDLFQVLRHTILEAIGKLPVEIQAHWLDNKEWADGEEVIHKIAAVAVLASFLKAAHNYAKS